MMHEHDHHPKLHEHPEHNHHEHEHDHHGHHHHGDFKTIFLRSLPIGILIMLMSPMMGIKLPLQFTFPYSDILVTMLASILLLYGGKPFYEGAYHEFKNKTPGMMALVSLGLSVSFIYSVFAVMVRYLQHLEVMDFYFEFASLVLIMLLGHWIEMNAVGDAGDARASLAALLPKDAQVILKDGSIDVRPIHQLVKGDRIRVQAGENIPADGIVVLGESRVNEALLTGESKPTLKQLNDMVIGGSTNGDGFLFIEVTEVGEKSFISQVQTLITNAQMNPSKAENMASKVAGWLFYIAVIVSIFAFVVWFIVSDLPTAIRYTVTTLVIACPHALGLAIPLVVARSTSLGAKHGLLVKDRQALELATQADVMVLDKTGTLTTGVFEVLQISPISDLYSKATITSFLAGIEAGSSHPIAQSIIQYAEDKEITPTEFESIQIIQGEGMRGQYNGITYRLISENAYGETFDLDLPQGATISILLEDENPIGVVALGDTLKKSSYDLINNLKSRNIMPILATGDNELAAKVVADALDIDYYSNQSPQDKYDLIQSLKADHQTVIMVGDGVNDAPSLALSDVGVAIGAGTQVALDSADIILTQSDPSDVIAFLRLSQKTSRKMKENLLWGAGYNFIALPLAAGLLAPIGITISPAVGAILMSVSTIVVAFNAMLLKID